MTDKQLAELAANLEAARARARRINIQLVALRKEYDVAVDAQAKAKESYDAARQQHEKEIAADAAKLAANA